MTMGEREKMRSYTSDSSSSVRVLYLRLYTDSPWEKIKAHQNDGKTTRMVEWTMGSL